MIQITSSTSLSIEKTAKLFQSLVDLKQENVELPAQILESMNALQEKFMEDMDTFLHTAQIYEHGNDAELNTVKAIVETSWNF